MQNKADPTIGIAISNPKLSTEPATSQDARFFPYYAGYSSVFAHEVLSSLSLKPDSVVFDPWNGSGTTTQVAYRLGHKAIGIDLNPAMVIAAKAAMLSRLDSPSLLRIALSIIQSNSAPIKVEADPLLQWLSPSSASAIRGIELEINRTLVSKESYVKLNDSDALDQVSYLAAFFYVALFHTVRRLLSDFIPSNPTWVKKPKELSQRKRPSERRIQDEFVGQVENLAKKTWRIPASSAVKGEQIIIKMGNAENIPLLSQSVDAIVSSPPYCTRIDYAVATSLELAVLGFDLEEFDNLRRSLTGTSTVGAEVNAVDPIWGRTCLEFLEKLHSHPSRASQGYYYKNHVQYFSSLSRSIKDISRVLKPDGYFVMVVQGSHYKEINNDVPSIAVEMASAFGLNVVQRSEFSSGRSMVGINGRSRKYLSRRKTTESVIIFRR